MAKKKDNPSFDFENAMSELETIAQKLDNNELTLDKSLDEFEKGMSLAKQCEKELEKATGRVTKIMEDFSEENLDDF